MATSLALLAGAGWTSAQAPQWDSGVPAKTQWAPFPTDAPKAPAVQVPAVLAPAVPVSAVPVPIAIVPPLVIPTVEQPAQIGTRVILFQKPAENPPPSKPGDPKPVDPKTGEPAVINPVLPTKAEPSKDEVFRMPGDDDRHAAILKLANTQKPTAINPALARAEMTPPRQVLLEPGYMVHRRLFFEEKNAERYGWDLGFAQPFVSVGYFYKDLLLWPSKLGSNLHERYSTNAGKFLPGSPVPYYLYPQEITLVGASLGAAAIIGTAFLLP